MDPSNPQSDTSTKPLHPKTLHPPLLIFFVGFFSHFSPVKNERIVVVLVDTHLALRLLQRRLRLRDAAALGAHGVARRGTARRGA